jgi:hypothetical protein
MLLFKWGDDGEDIYIYTIIMYNGIETIKGDLIVGINERKLNCVCVFC